MDSSYQKNKTLRKKLRQLFPNEEFKLPVAGKTNVNKPHGNVKIGANTQKIRTTDDKQVKESISVPNECIYKKVEKDPSSQKKGSSPSKSESKHSRQVKIPKNKKCDNISKRSKEFKQKQSRTNNSKDIKNSEKNKVKNQLKESLKLKKNVGVRNKSSKRNFENDRHVSKTVQQSKLKQNNLVENGQSTVNNNRKRKANAHTAVEDTLNNKTLAHKKKKKVTRKLNKRNKISTEANSNTKFLTHESSPPHQDEYHINGMSGYVRGGEFDTDNTLGYNNQSHRFDIYDKTILDNFDYNESCDDSDDEYNEFADFYGDSSEGEEEEYYDSDEDSYNYSTESDDYTSSFEYCESEISYDNENDSDKDYELPEYVAEDLIIHKGTATKYDLKPENNVSFDSENEEAQIVELDDQQPIKVIHQPKAYEKEELLKLKYEEKSSSSNPFQNNEIKSYDPDDCPKLVPIVDENRFEPQNSNMAGEVRNEQQSLEDYETDSVDYVSIGSDYMEVNSDEADSMLSDDINDKYLNRDTDSSSSIDETIWNNHHKADIIDATSHKFENNFDNFANESNSILNDDINQIPSVKLYENVDLKTESSILCTTIVNNETLIPNDTAEIELHAITNATQEIPSETVDLGRTEEMNVIPEEDDLMKAFDTETERSAKYSPKCKKLFGQNIEGYNTKFFNALDSNFVLVLIKDPFFIYGTVRLTLLAGVVEIYGYSLILNTEVEVFSPRGCSIIEIASSKRKNMSKEDLKQILKSYEQYFALADLKRIVYLYNHERDAVVLLKRNENRKKVVHQFKKFMNENVFPNINNISVDRPLYNSEFILRCMINTFTQKHKCLRLSKQWKQISITSKSCVMLVGGKGVGKSTLLRYLINRQLPQPILLIDLDIGQPEIFVPQTVSCTIIKEPLLGPGFFLNIQPDLSYVVGHTNITLCAHKYVEAVRRLITHCKAKEEYRDIPWIINTMGYNKGFGLELISVIAKELPLTDVVQLQSNRSINNFDTILHPQVLSSAKNVLFPEECSNQEKTKNELNYRLHVWKSAVQQESRYQKEWEMSPKDTRFAILLSRLSEALQGHALWLTDVKPLSAPFDDVRIIDLINNTSTTSKEDLAKSVEANLVYLCHCENDVNEPLKCLGIGVVRSVDYHIRQLYLIPALPHARLKDVNCIAIGEMSLPTSVFTNQGPRVKNIAPFVYNTVAANASKAIKQIYHRPLKFLTGKRKSLT